MDASSLSPPNLVPRTRPMEVLVLGLCRTGTLSMKHALQTLGYQNVYHMTTVHSTPGHPSKWLAAMKSKYEGDGSLLTREFFDDLLGDYDAATDIPPACFVPELIRAYPEAKIILTTRDAESWAESMNETIYGRWSSLPPLVARFWTPHWRTLYQYLTSFFVHYFHSDFPHYSLRVFNEHNQLVRALSPPERFLEFRVKEGWGPLCEFLGKEIPKEAFPRVNDREEWRGKAGIGKEKGNWLGVGGLGMGFAIAAGVFWRMG